jgi:hypothetical protein
MKEEHSLIETQENRGVEIDVEEINELKNQIKEMREREVDTKGKFDTILNYVEGLHEKLEEKERKKNNKWYKNPFGKSTEILNSTDKKTKGKKVTSSEHLPTTSENSNDKDSRIEPSKLSIEKPAVISKDESEAEAMHEKIKIPPKKSLDPNLEYGISKKVEEEKNEDSKFCIIPSPSIQVSASQNAGTRVSDLG